MDKAGQDGKKSGWAAFMALFRARDTVNIRNVRLKHLRYMLIFPLAPVFANMQGALFSGATRLFGLDAMTLMGSAYCVGAGRGQQADWFKNILANPHVELQVRSRRLKAIAEPVTDPARIADFLALRLRRHPLIVGQILHMDGLSRTPTRDELLRYAGRLAMVTLRPQP